MRYIEFIGPPAAGKSYYKRILEKKLKVIKKKKFVTEFYLKNKRRSLLDKLIVILINIYYSDYIDYLKIPFKRKKQIQKIGTQVYFKNKRNTKSNFTKIFNFDYQYYRIAKKLFYELNLDRDRLFLILNLYINRANLKSEIKKRFNLWLIDNFLYMKILEFKKKSKLSLILDEGIIHRIFFVYSLINEKEKKKFLQKCLKFYTQQGIIYNIVVSNNKYLQNFKKRKKKNIGFVHFDINELLNDKKNYIKFTNYLKKRIKIIDIKKENDIYK